MKTPPHPIVVLAGLLLFACGGQPPEQTRARPPTLPPDVEPVRITMDMLHQAGGVPPGWRFTLPQGDVAAGRQAFVDLGCHSCHAVAGEAFSPANDPAHVGPELSGMGSHHPALYFVESILTPDAVLVDGPGYITDDDRSRMPAYPDLTVTQLADLVAYLQSLTTGGSEYAPPAPTLASAPRPAPPASAATIFFVQVYDVQRDRLATFQDWFAREGGPALRAVDGLLAIDTYVDNTRPGPALVTIMSFRDDAALAHFLQEPGGAALKQKWDDFIGPHGHQMFRIPPVYRVASLSAP